MRETEEGRYFQHHDWHTPSWLYLKEIEEVLKANPSTWVPPEFLAILASMKTLEDEYGLGATRLVFWFDN